MFRAARRSLAWLGLITVPAFVVVVALAGMAQAASYSLTPAAGPPGTTVRFQASGLATNETYCLALDGQNLWLGSPPASSVDVTFTIPPGTPPGVKTARFFACAHPELLIAELSFTVLVGVPTPTPTRSPTPSPSATASPSPTVTATATPTATPSPSPVSTRRAVVPGVARDGLPPPPPPAIDSAFLSLADRMAAAIDAYPYGGNYAVAVLDLQTGEVVSVNGNRKQLSGCVMNFFVLLQATLDVQDGRRSQDEVDALIASTTWSSNATTARELYEVVGDGDTHRGLERVRVLIARLGLKNTVLDHPPAYPEQSLGIDASNWMTAEDGVRALQSLWRGEVLTPAWRDYLMDHLHAVKPGLNYLTAYVHEGTVSHKNGFLEYEYGSVDNDIGIVRFTRGGTEYAYTIAFLAEEVPWKYADITLGQNLSLMANEYFLEKY